MFRTAILRSAAVARTAAARPVIARLGAAATPFASRAAPLAVAQKYNAWNKGFVRGYAGGGALAKEEVEGRIMDLLKGFDKVNDPANISQTAHFANDLGLDSLDTVEVVMAIEEEFSIEIPDKDADTIHSIDKAVEYILAQPHAN